MKLLLKCALIASTLFLVLADRPLPADPALPDLPALTPDAEVSEVEPVPDSPALPEPAPFEGRTIGNLFWHTNYSAAYREAREARNTLFVFFRDDLHPRIADLYEHDILAHADAHDTLSKVVRVVVPLDTLCPTCNEDETALRMLAHQSFKYMYGRQGIAVIDLTNPESELFGQVISAHPFTPGRYYTVHGTKTVLGLPLGTVTQRALIYDRRQVSRLHVQNGQRIVETDGAIRVGRTPRLGQSLRRDCSPDRTLGQRGRRRCRQHEFDRRGDSGRRSMVWVALALGNHERPGSHFRLRPGPRLGRQLVGDRRVCELIHRIREYQQQKPQVDANHFYNAPVAVGSGQFQSFNRDS
jgi:hypothetical protein